MMIFESVCRQCKFCVQREIRSPGANGQPGLYQIECDEGSPNLLSQDGCWMYAPIPDGEEDE